MVRRVGESQGTPEAPKEEEKKGKLQRPPHKVSYPYPSDFKASFEQEKLYDESRHFESHEASTLDKFFQTFPKLAKFIDKLSAFILKYLPDLKEFSSSKDIEMQDLSEINPHSIENEDIRDKYLGMVKHKNEHTAKEFLNTVSKYAEENPGKEIRNLLPMLKTALRLLCKNEEDLANYAVIYKDIPEYMTASAIRKDEFQAEKHKSITKKAFEQTSQRLHTPAQIPPPTQKKYNEIQNEIRPFATKYNVNFVPSGFSGLKGILVKILEIISSRRIRIQADHPIKVPEELRQEINDLKEDHEKVVELQERVAKESREAVTIPSEDLKKIYTYMEQAIMLNRSSKNFDEIKKDIISTLKAQGYQNIDSVVEQYFKSKMP